MPGFATAARLVYPSRSLLPNKVRATIDFLKRRLRPSDRVAGGGTGRS